MSDGTADVRLHPILPDQLDSLFSLASDFAMSFTLDEEAFRSSALGLLEREDAWLRGAFTSNTLVGYALGFDHLTLFANGRVSWLEEIMVAEDYRRRGVGRALMVAFESWAGSRGSKLIALATRRAASFYEALGYEASATYYRRVLPGVDV